MKRFAYYMLIAAAGLLASCLEDEAVTDYNDYSYNQSNSSSSSSSSGSKSTSSASAATSTSSDSSSEYVNTDPTTIDFTNDFIANNFSASATTTITYSDGSATVSGLLDGDEISTSGGYVTAKLHNSGTVLRVTGSTSSGTLYVESDYKFELNLASASIANPYGSAINIQSGHCFVVLEGSNSLTDGSSATYEDDYTSSAKSVFHSEDKLRFSGSGSLKITASNAQEKHGLSSDDWIVVDGATLTVTSGSGAGQGIKVNDGFYMNDGDVTVSASNAAKKGINSEAFVYVADGTLNASATGGYAYDDDDKEYKAASAISADGYVTIKGGEVTAKCSGAGGKAVNTNFIFNMKGGELTATATGSDTSSSVDKAPKGIKADGGILIEDGEVNASSSNHEAIESKSILTVTGGVVYAKAKDDAINSASDMTLSSGYVCAYSTGNDAIDANGNLYLNGSVVYAVSTAGGAETAIDANTEGGYTLYVQGGTLVAYPSLENGAQLTQTCSTVSISSTSSWNAIYNGSEPTLAFKAIKSGTYVVSTPSTAVKTGVTVSGGTSIFGGYGYRDASVSGGSEASLGTYSGGMGMGMGGGMGGWH